MNYAGDTRIFDENTIEIFTGTKWIKYPLYNDLEAERDAWEAQAKYDGELDYKHEVADRLEQLEAKCQRYKDALREIANMGEGYDAAMIKVAEQALENKK